MEFVALTVTLGSVALTAYAAVAILRDGSRSDWPSSGGKVTAALAVLTWIVAMAGGSLLAARTSYPVSWTIALAAAVGSMSWYIIGLSFAAAVGGTINWISGRRLRPTGRRSASSLQQRFPTHLDPIPLHRRAINDGRTVDEQ